MTAAIKHAIHQLRDRKPLQGLSSTQRAELQRLYGMHSPRIETRIGTDAFEIRDDVSLGDAVMTLDVRLSMLLGVLILVQSSVDPDDPCAAALSACQTLAEEAGGALAVLAEAMFEHGVEGAEKARQGEVFKQSGERA